MKLRVWVWIVLVLGLAGLGAFLLWASNPLQAAPEARDALHGDSEIAVDTSHWIVFQPAASHPDTGMIFYPGGHIDPVSYAPLARAIAKRSYLVVIVPMPLNLAAFAPDRALDVMHAYPAIKHWVVGGHSLGGAMAANFVHNHADRVDGLILLAAYPGGSDDLSSLPNRVLSIYGTNDGLTGIERYQQSQTLLPANTRWVQIEGGNHAQFGDYGIQPGDQTASVSLQEQQSQTLNAILDFLSGSAQ